MCQKINNNNYIDLRHASSHRLGGTKRRRKGRKILIVFLIVIIIIIYNNNKMQTSGVSHTSLFILNTNSIFNINL